MPLMKAEIQAAFLAASLTGCNQENPSVLFTHTAGTQPYVPQEENPCHSLPPLAIPMVPPDLYKFQPTKKQGQDQSTHSCPAPQRLPPLHPGGAGRGGSCPLPAVCRSSPADVRSQEWPRTGSCRPAPRLAGRTLSAASSLAVAERGGCLRQLSSKPWCGRACLGSILVSRNYKFCN